MVSPITGKDTGLQIDQIHNLSHTWFVPNRQYKKGSIDTPAKTMTRIPWQLFLKHFGSTEGIIKPTNLFLRHSCRWEKSNERRSSSLRKPVLGTGILTVILK